MRILVTGAAGFIGYHVCHHLLERGDVVVGIDNLSSYYDPELKLDRLSQLTGKRAFRFERLNLTDTAATVKLRQLGAFDTVVHLAAQAGVRYSQQAPRLSIANNVAGTLNVLETCRARPSQRLVFASSSSVYGETAVFPVKEDADITRPLSLYAASKSAGELMCYSYAYQFGLAITGLRLFTVYGPWGRPDMAIFKFTEAILAGRPVELFAGGMLRRDFTYIDDTIQGILGAIDHSPAGGREPFRMYNVGRGKPVAVTEMLNELERSLGLPAVRRVLPPQLGDVTVTCADIRAAEAELQYRPRISLRDGVARFVDWYCEHYKDSSASRQLCVP